MHLRSIGRFPLLMVLAIGCRAGDKSPFDEEDEILPEVEEVDEDRDGVSADEDCDDGDSSVYPGAAEICDGLDNDCDEEIDEGVLQVFYADADGDGFGDDAEMVESCEAPSGYVASGEDCDDGDPESYPGASERCDGIDNDCDAAIDEDVRSTWYADVDSDGYGDAAVELEDCDPPSGYVDDATDCDDASERTYPGAEEICDYADNDCDSEIDEGVLRTFYMDSDGDEYGDPDFTTEDCTVPDGYAEVAEDCDDGDAAISPAASEICDEVDNDCDGTVDENDAVDAATWYLDADGDGYGDASEDTVACESPSGYVSDDSDCDDRASAINPAATEVCDEEDNDCDGVVDGSDAIDAETWYADWDGDGYGSADDTTVSCEQPTDYLEDATDCEDSDADAYPGSTATETPGDGIDTDCDGVDACTDLSCDGIPDMVMAGYYSGSSYSSDTLLFYGSGTDFSDSDSSALTAAGIHDAVAEDLDGDGYIDVVLSTYYSGSSYYGDSYVYWGGPSGYSSADREDIETGGAIDVLAEDLDGDGYRDLVFTGYYIGSYYSYTYVYYGSSRGYSTGAVEYLYSPGAVQAAAADLDGDGDLDLVSCRHYAYAYDLDSYIFWNDGGFSDSNRTDLGTHGCHDLKIDDLDGDGWNEILFAGYYGDGTGYSTTGQIYWGSASGYSDSDLTELPTYGSLGVDAGDFNGDGYTDVVFGSYYSGSSYVSNAWIYYGDAGGYDASVYDTVTSYGTWDLTVGDLDLDGYDDLVLASYYSGSSYSSTSSVYYGSAAGIAAGSPDLLSTTGTRGVAVGDLDGNGYPELVFNHYYSGSWSSLVGSTVYWGDGSGYSGSRSTELDTAGTVALPVLVGTTDWE